MKSPVVSLILVLLLMDAAQAQSQSVNLSAWKKVNACDVSFSLPVNVREVRAYPVDSCVKRYRSDEIAVELDVIFSSHNPRTEKLFRDSVSSKPGFQIKEVEISGVRSLIGTYYKSNVPEENLGLHYYSTLLIPSIGKDKRGLMMRIYSKTPDGVTISQKVFESISPKKGK